MPRNLKRKLASLLLLLSLSGCATVGAFAGGMSKAYVHDQPGYQPTNCQSYVVGNYVQTRCQ